MHHGLCVASTGRATVSLRKLVLLMRRAELWLVWLRVRASHWRHSKLLTVVSYYLVHNLLLPGGMYICGPCAPGCMYIICGCW